MNKQELVSAVAEKSGMTKREAKLAVDAMVDSTLESLSIGEDVNFTPLGKFSLIDRKARVGRNPQTGEELNIPARRAVKFKASKGLKEAVNV